MTIKANKPTTEEVLRLYDEVAGSLDEVREQLHVIASADEQSRHLYHEVWGLQSRVQAKANNFRSLHA